MLTSLCYAQVDHHSVIARRNVPYTLWYVDRDVAGGDGSGDSWTNAVDSVSIAFSKAILSGDSVYVSGGADSTLYFDWRILGKYYTSDVVITKGREAGHNGDVYFRQRDGSWRYSFGIQNCSYIKLENLNFIWNSETVSDSTTIYMPLYIVTSTNITVNNCSIISNGMATGINIGYCTDLTITNNTIQILPNTKLMSQDGIWLGEGSGGHTITGNKFYLEGANATSEAAHHDAIQIVHEGSASNYEFVIANNLFWANTDSGMANAISIQESYSNRYSIYNNIIGLNTGGMGGIYCGAPWAGFEATSDISLRIFNNTIMTTNNGGSSAAFLIGTYGYPDTLIVKNNIFMNEVNEIFSLYVPTMATMSSVDIDYNSYYNPNGLLFYANAGYRNFATWQGYGYDANGMNDLPNFVTAYDSVIASYKLVTSEAQIGAGIDLSSEYPSLATDILGVTRSDWNMGATEEYVIVNLAAGATWATGSSDIYETFTSSGNSITSAINTAGNARAITSLFDIVTDKVYQISFTLTLNSGTVPGIIRFNTTLTGNEGSADYTNVQEGANSFSLIATATGSYGFFIYQTTTTDYSLTGLVIEDWSE